MPIDCEASSKDLAKQYQAAVNARDKVTYRLIEDLLKQRGDVSVLKNVSLPEDEPNADGAGQPE